MTAAYAFATPLYAVAVDLRQRSLRLPLGLDIADDPLADEHADLHLGAFEDGELVGTASLRRHADGVLQMRQVAVEPEHHGRGVGRALVAACERAATREGASRLFCHARAVVRPFYEACGWAAEGEVFTEVGIEHVTMSAPEAALRAPRQG